MIGAKLPHAAQHRSDVVARATAVVAGSLCALLAHADAAWIDTFEAMSSEGWTGHGLELGSPDGVVRRLSEPLSNQRGTLSLWVRPHAGKTNHSYTLISFHWSGSPSNYFALSQGWWEPIFADRLMLVVSNQAGAFCAAPRGLRPDRWTHVSASWSGIGPSGYCRLYIDGTRVATERIAIPTIYRSATALHLGSDAGASDRRGRTAYVTLDDLEYRPSAITDREARARYERAVPDKRERLRREFDWAEPFTARGASMPAPRSETRALFDESWQWARSRADVDHLVDLARRANMNVIVPCVWHGQGTTYPSRIAYRHAKLPEQPDFDALDYLLRRARLYDIEVHPWLTIALREDERLPQFHAAGLPNDSYDLQSEEFREYMTRLIEDMVLRYPVAGVHLDYIRTMGICQSQRCARAYAARNGRELLADISHAGTDPAARRAIQEWQDDAVRQMVASIAARVRRVRPRALLSVSGTPLPSGSLRPLQGRDELGWLRAGLIDAVFSMEYEAIPDHARLRRVAAEVAEPHQLLWTLANFELLDGVATARSGDSVALAVHAARALTPGVGIGIYLRAMMSPEHIEALTRGPFSNRVAAAWKPRQP